MLGELDRLLEHMQEVQQRLERMAEEDYNLLGASASLRKAVTEASEARERLRLHEKWE